MSRAPPRSPNRLVEVTLDSVSIPRGAPDRDHERDDRLSGELIGLRHDGRLGDLFVGGDRRFAP